MLQHMHSHLHQAAVSNSFYTVLTKTVENNGDKQLTNLGHRCLNPGLYAYHLERWLTYFPPSQVSSLLLLGVKFISVASPGGQPLLFSLFSLREYVDFCNSKLDILCQALFAREFIFANFATVQTLVNKKFTPTEAPFKRIDKVEPPSERRCLCLKIRYDHVQAYLPVEHICTPIRC